MRFDLLSAFFAPEVEDHLRREILGFAVDGRHVVLVSQAAQADLASWRQRQAPDVREEVDFALEASLEEEARSPHHVRVLVGGASIPDDWGASPPRLSARTARDMGRQALRLVVEDLDSDKAFLLAVAPREFSDRLLSLLSQGWVDVVHGGGSRLPRVVEDAEGDPCRCRRMFVLFDSDALRPQDPSSRALSLQGLCRRLQVEHHCLERREIENYLPPQALGRWAGCHWRKRGEHFKAWVRLAAVQRHHFDMKYGFADKDVPDLYDGVAENDRMILATGFGDHIWREFDHVKQDWVDRDGQRPELMRLFSAILRLR